MAGMEQEINELAAAVSEHPTDPYRRCNLALMLAAGNGHAEALGHLGIAMEYADNPVAAGCVREAIRQLTADFSRLWKLPSDDAPVLMLSA